MATMEFIGDGRSELDTIQQQWLQGDRTIEVLAISDEVLMRGRQLGEKMVQPDGLIRRRIVYERLGPQTERGRDLIQKLRRLSDRSR